MKPLRPIRSLEEYETIEERIRRENERAVNYYESCRPRHRWHNDFRLVIWRKMHDSLLMGGLLLLGLALLLAKMLVKP